MRYALLVLVLSILACRVEGVDYDADLWTDGDVEVDADADLQIGCPSACGDVDCSQRGVCDMDLSDCTPYCLCMAGYHQGGDGLECIAN